MSTTPTLEAASTSAIPTTPAVRRYRLAVLLLVLALAASIAAAIYLAVGSSSTAGSATTPPPPGSGQVCYRPAVPC